MENHIQNSKNVVTGHIDAQGSVWVGDKIIINLKEAAEYIALEKAIEELKNELKETQLESEENPSIDFFNRQLIKLSQKLNERQQELATLKTQVIELAKTFERIDLDTERLQKAKFHFYQGEFKAARAVLDAEMMTNELDALLNKKERLHNETTENNKNLEDKADEFLILAQLTAIDFEDKNRFHKTIDYFESSLKATRNVNNLFAFAHFLQKHNQNNKATPLYEEALTIYQQLAEVNPQTYLPDLADTLNNLGILQSTKNEFVKAEKSYEEALSIYRQLAEVNPQTYLQYVAVTLNNLANLQSRKNEFEKGEKSYEEALSIYRQLAEVNPQTYLRYVGGTLNNLGLLQSDNSEFVKAEKFYEEALTIKRQLAEMNPKTYLPDYATTQINMAIFYLQSKLDKEKAFEYVDSAIDNLLPFQEIGYIQNYLKVAVQILQVLGVDLKKYFEGKENRSND